MNVASYLSPVSFARGALAFAIAAGIGGAAVACSDDEITAPPTNTTPTPEATTDAGSDAPAGKPLYALGVLVIANGTQQTTYMHLLDSFDTQPTLATTNAREFAGYAPAMPVGGKLIMSSGDAPKLTRYAIGEDKSWAEDASLGFGNYSQTPLTQSMIVSDALAFAPFDALGYVGWNPTTFALGAEVPQPAGIPLQKDGLGVYRGYAYITSNQYAYQPFYYTNPTFSQVGRSSVIGILDGAANAWVATPEVACPHLHLTTKDDDGNMYFSPGQYSIPAAVLDSTFPRNCMVRIKAGQTAVDSEFGSVSFKDLAEGREGSNFFYIGNGIGFFNAYHAERDNIGPETAPSTVMYSANYHLWTYDLNTKTAAIMPGVDFAGGQYTSYRIDNRVFVAIPSADYSSTAVYEITPAGVAEKRFDTVGWAFNMFRVR